MQNIFNNILEIGLAVMLILTNLLKKSNYQQTEIYLKSIMYYNKLENTNNNNKIYDVLPSTKSAEIYSFGIIMYV